jgi:hypothetical protein
MKSLEIEIQYRLSIGYQKLSVKAFRARFLDLGYDLDRSLDCRSVARYLHDDRTYPACIVYPIERDTRLSFANTRARRDSNFDKLQAMRLEIFAVSRGAILEA